MSFGVNWTTARTELEGPLAKSAVKEREQAGRKLSYVEGWHVIAEANRIFGFNTWTRETVDLRETHRELVTVSGSRGTYQQWRVSYLAKVRITVDGVVREGTGYGSGMGKPEALGDAIESAAKEAETDAMKRAFMTFGNPFGLALYDKTQANVVDDEPQAAPVQQPAPAKLQTFEKSPIVKEAYKVIDTWLNKIGNTGTLEDLQTFWVDNQDTIKSLPADWKKELTAKKDEIKEALKGKVAA